MFELFGPAHFFGIFLTIIWAVLMYYISNRKSKAIQVISTLSGFILISFYPIFLFFRLQENSFDIVYHLPLQISNLILFFVGMSLIFNNKLWYSLAMIWAFPGGLVSVLLPDIRNTFPHQDYFFFWISHAVLIGYCVFLFHYRTFKLSITDALKSLGIFLVYIMLVYPLNMRIESNYGYLRNLPPSLDLPQVLQLSQNYVPIFFVIMVVITFGVIQIHTYFDQLVKQHSPQYN